MKAVSKGVLACVLFFALAGNAWAASPKDLGSSIRTLSGIRSLAAADDDIPGVAAPASPINGTLSEVEGAEDFDDVYAVHLNAGETLTLSLTGAVGTDFDMLLFAPGATSLFGEVAPVAEAFSDVYPENLQYYATVTGTYYLDAYTANGSGAYTLTYSAAVSPIKPVWRFFNTSSGSHFYTATLSERNNVVNTLSGTYDLDGVAYWVNTANVANNSPLYRFYNKVNGSHFYTATLAEKNDVETNLSATYQYDGPGYNVCLTPGGTTVWRFYNVTNGTHFYTASLAEKNDVIANLSDTYKLDGPGFYLAP